MGKIRCRCRGHGAPEIIDPCIRDLVDCLNRHGVKTISSCCGHGHDRGDIILDEKAIKPHPHNNGTWILRLNKKPIQIRYCDAKAKWIDKYPVGGK